MKIIFAKTKKFIKFGKVKVKKEDIVDGKIKKKKGHFKIRVEGKKITLFYKKFIWMRIFDDKVEREIIVFDEKCGFSSDIMLFVFLAIFVVGFYILYMFFPLLKTNEPNKFHIEMGKELENIEHLIKNIGKEELKKMVDIMRMEIEKINQRQSGPTGFNGPPGEAGPCPVGAPGPPGLIGVSVVKKEREKPLGPQGIGPCRVGLPGEIGKK